TVQQVGSPRDVYERPANIFVADFMGLVNKVPGTLVERQGTSARVRIGDQTIEACTIDGVDPRGAIVVAIRPEAVRFGDSAPVAGSNVPAGKLVESTFLGNIVDHQIDVGGSLMRVQGDRQQTLQPGAHVNLIVPITECVAMQGDVSQ